jgi:RHS repeat-associated protein
MTKMPHLQAMVWSEDDHLRATTRTAGGATPPTTYYTYDSGGQRLRKIVENQTATRASERIYLGGVEVYREFAADGTTIDLSRETFSVTAGEQVGARIETRTLGTDPGSAQQVRYQFANHLNSAALELDDAADVISYEEYFPFGATSYQAVASQTEVAKRYRYSGKERDDENGLNYHRARYYAAWLGRWTSPDPLGIADGPDVYRFVNNNPLSLVDKSGTEGKDPDVAKETKEKVQETIKNVQGEIDEINKTSGPLQVAQWELVNARDALRPDQKEEQGQLQKQIDINAKTLNALSDRADRLQTIIDESQKTLKEFDAPPDYHSPSDVDVQGAVLGGYDPGSKGAVFIANFALTFPHFNPAYHVEKDGGSNDFWRGGSEHRVGINILSGLGPAVQVQGILDAPKPLTTAPLPVYRSQLSLGAGVNLLDVQVQHQTGTAAAPKYEGALLDVQVQLQYFHQRLAEPLGGPLTAPSARWADQGGLGVNIDWHFTPHVSGFVQGGVQFSTAGGFGLSPFVIGVGFHTEKQ